MGNAVLLAFVATPLAMLTANPVFIALAGVGIVVAAGGLLSGFIRLLLP